MDILEQFIAAYQAQIEDMPAPEIAQEQVKSWTHRQIIRLESAPTIERRTTVPITDYRSAMDVAIYDYMMTPDPGYILLVQAPPGSGKTWAGVKLAHRLYTETGHRTFYAGPRKDFYGDILRTSVKLEENLDLWYDWKARQENEDLRLHTCNHTKKITEWMNLGYEGMDFCERVCHWDYINNECPYHKQKYRTEPLIYGHHAHVFLGHPLAKEFAFLIGDELPLDACLHEWTLSPQRVQLLSVPYESPLAPILVLLKRLCSDGISKTVFGPDLLDRLGGAVAVRDAIDDEMIAFWQSAVILAPSLDSNADLERIPANYLPVLLPILKAEATAAAAGVVNYPTRLSVDKAGLTIQTRRTLNEQMPQHCVWFDATGTAELYEQIFGRPVKTLDVTPEMKGTFIQVTDRGNGKGSITKTIVSDEKTTIEETSRGEQLRAQIAHIQAKYKRPGVITFKAIEEDVNGETGHFGGNRGSNDFEECDAIIVAGTPLPPLYAIEKIAKMLWPDRMRPFDNATVIVQRPYVYVGPEGEGYAYPVFQYADPALNTILWQKRDAEIYQSAHRGRPLIYPIPTYILSNIPIDILPPDRLITIRELLDAPEGVNPFKWAEVVSFAEKAGQVGTKDLIEKFGLSTKTARKYVEIIADLPGWELLAIKSDGRGRPQTGAKRDY